MKYNDIIPQAENDDYGKPLSVDIKTWKEVGDSIIGELVEIKPFEGGDFETKCNQYLFKTDDGLASCILGSSMDKIFEVEDYVGRILYIKYKGKLELEDGRRCNKFQISDMTDVFHNMLKTQKDDIDAAEID